MTIAESFSVGVETQECDGGMGEYPTLEIHARVRILEKACIASVDTLELRLAVERACAECVELVTRAEHEGGRSH